MKILSVQQQFLQYYDTETGLLGNKTVCTHCGTPPFNQLCSFGLKPFAMFTKAHTDFELAQIKAVNIFYKFFLEVLKHLPLTKVNRVENHHSSNIFKKIFSAVRKSLKTLFF